MHRTPASAALVLAALLAAACSRAHAPRAPTAPGVAPPDVSTVASTVALPDAFTLAPPRTPTAWLAPALPLPAPPAQQRAFAPPPSDGALPPAFDAAAAVLFSLGLADPRGCEYRAVELVAGDVHGGPGERVATHAWLLPAAASDSHRFAVAWNGLVYPVILVGDSMDLAVDINASLAPTTHDAGAPRPRFHLAVDEPRGVAVEAVSHVRAALLARLGQRALAGRMFRALGATTPEQPPSALFDALASEWSWSLEDRALCAHMRGDRSLALASARLLNAVHDPLTAEHDRLAGTSAARPGSPPPALALGPRDGLLALERDLERRIAAPASELPAPSAPATERIAALIRALDEVAVPQSGQPGGVPLEFAPAVVRLIAMGDAAVGPLLDALEHDERLTRSVQYWRDFTHDRHVLPVALASQLALEAILQTAFHAAPGEVGAPARRAIAAEARAYWDRFHGAARDERFFMVLADDHATAAQWVEAADWLSTPSESRTAVSAYVTSRASTRQGALADLALDGDRLRTRHAPSVTELIVRRMDALWSDGDSAQDIAHYSRRSDSCALAGALARWDARGALAALARQTERARAQLARDAGHRSVGDEYDGRMVGCFASTALIRALAGDASGVDAYAAWITTVEPWRMPSDTDFYLEPLWYAPERPAVARALDALFARPDPRWVPLAGVVARGDRGYSDYTRWLTSPLVAVPAFRDHVLRPGFADQTVIGEYTVTASRGYHLTIQGGGGESGGLPEHVTDPPAAGTQVPVRRCDYYAYRVTEGAGGLAGGPPEFRLDWPQARRDAALPQILAFVERPR